MKHHSMKHAGTKEINYAIQLVLIGIVILTGLYYLIRPVLDNYLIQTEGKKTQNYIQSNSIMLNEIFSSLANKYRNGCHIGDITDSNCRTDIPHSLNEYKVLGLNISGSENEDAQMLRTLNADGYWEGGLTVNPEFIPQNAKLVPLFKGISNDSILWNDYFPSRQNWFVATPVKTKTTIVVLAKKISCTDSLCSLVLFLRKALR